MTPIVCFAIVAIIFSIGDAVSYKTKGIVSSLIVVILVLILFGGTLKILPADLMETSGLLTMIPTFGMPLILTGLGSTINLADLVKEYKTVLISLGSVLGLFLIGIFIGPMIFSREYALASLPSICGGTVATMLMGEAAKVAGRTDLQGYISAVNALQVLIGLPLASFLMRRGALDYANKNLNSQNNILLNTSSQTFPLINNIPAFLETPVGHLARLSIFAVLADVLAKATGIPATITYLLVGCIAASIGFISVGALEKGGAQHILMLATYAMVTESFLTMNFKEFYGILFPVFGMLILCSIGIVAVSYPLGKFLKLNPFLSCALGFSCMLGYPLTFAVAYEITKGISKERNFSEKEEQIMYQHLVPKMVISGIISVSIASVVMASMIIPKLFG